MLQKEIYQDVFGQLEQWSDEIFSVIKKEIKNDYMRHNPQFFRKYFAKKDPAKLTAQELGAACLQEVKEGNEELGEWLISRWLVKHGDMYQFFATELSKINPQFDEIEVISDEASEALVRVSSEQFGLTTTYVFCVLNQVRLASGSFEKLRKDAETEKNTVKPVEEKASEGVEATIKRYEGIVQKLTEKYEKRLQGLEQKYFNDVEGLKKQIAQLHRRLSGSSS